MQLDDWACKKVYNCIIYSSMPPNIYLLCLAGRHSIITGGGGLIEKSWEAPLPDGLYRVPVGYTVVCVGEKKNKPTGEVHPTTLYYTIVPT